MINSTKPIAWIRMLHGEIDWAEDCLKTKNELTRDDSEDGYSVVPVFLHANLPPKEHAELAALRKEHKLIDAEWRKDKDELATTTLACTLLETETIAGRKELLTLHAILMCPANCPPIQESDTQTVRLLKGVVAQWHNVEAELERLRKEKIVNTVALTASLEENEQLRTEKTELEAKLKIAVDFLEFYKHEPMAMRYREVLTKIGELK